MQLCHLSLVSPVCLCPDMHLHLGDKQIGESKLTLSVNVTLTYDLVREEK